MVNIEGLNVAKVLAALYNASRPRGMGFLSYDPKPMTEEEAWALLNKIRHFDYLKGRALQVSLDNAKEFDEWMYDRANGSGAAQAVVDQLRITGRAEGGGISFIHETGKQTAADEALTLADTKSSFDESSNTFKLGADEKGPRLREAVKKAIGQG